MADDVNFKAQPLDDSLRLLFRHVNGLANQLRADRYSGMILQSLERQGPQTVPQIARNRVTSRQSVQVAVNRLQREGLIAFISNPAHKRSPLVHLTEVGKGLLGSVLEHEKQLLQSLGSEMPEGEINLVAEVLAKLRQAIQRGNPGLLAQTGKARKPEKPSERKQSKARAAPTPLEKEQTQAEPAGSAEAEITDNGFPVNLL